MIISFVLVAAVHEGGRKKVPEGADGEGRAEQ
jgi:hypothetical protein